MGSDDDRYDRLTERQRECLRLVGSGLQLKEVAQRLAVTPDAIRERLRAARETLGVDRSLSAARMLMEWESKRAHRESGSHLHDAYIRHVEPQKSVAARPESPSPEDVAGRSTGDRERGRNPVMQERQAAFEYDRLPPRQISRPLSQWLLRRRPNDRDTAERIKIILLAAILLAIILWGGAAVFINLSRALTDIAKHGG